MLLMKSRGEKMLRYPPLVAIDLSPPPPVREGVAVLLELVETYNSMMLPASGKKPAFDTVISAMLDPIIQMCEQAAEAHKSNGVGHSLRRSRTTSDPTQLSKSSVEAILSNGSSAVSVQNGERPSKIFLINCLSAIQQPLLRHNVASSYAKNLGDLINRHLHILVEKEVNAILRKCRLSDKMPLFRDALSSNTGGTPSATQLADTLEMSPTVLSECLKAFFGLILGSDSSLPEFDQMQVPKLRSEASMEVARSSADAYEVIYNVIMNPTNGYADPKSLARHPPDQIRTILGI